jgi:hypothetical protein
LRNGLACEIFGLEVGMSKVALIVVCLIFGQFVAAAGSNVTSPPTDKKAQYFMSCRKNLALLMFTEIPSALHNDEGAKMVFEASSSACNDAIKEHTKTGWGKQLDDPEIYGCGEAVHISFHKKSEVFQAEKTLVQCSKENIGNWKNLVKK